MNRAHAIRGLFVTAGRACALELTLVLVTAGVLGGCGGTANHANDGGRAGTKATDSGGRGAGGGVGSAGANGSGDVAGGGAGGRGDIVGSGGVVGTGGGAGIGGDAGVAGGTGGGAGQAGGAGGQIAFGCSPFPLGTGGSGAVGGAAGSGATADPCPPVDAPPTDDAALRAYRLVAAKQHAELQRVVGQYACGTSPLYRGTFAASDNAAAVSSAVGDLASGPVIASLETTTSDTLDFLSCDVTVTGTGVRALVVMATAQAKAIRLFQPLAETLTTRASLVTPPGTTWSGANGGCATCVADLRTGSPATIDIASSTLRGQYCDGSTPLTVTTSGHLSVLPAPAFDDIMEINQAFGDHSAAPHFVSQGADMVVTVDGAIYEGTATASGCDSSQRVTPYHVDWYVNRQNVKLRGLRNFRVDSPLVLCCSRGI